MMIGSDITFIKPLILVFANYQYLLVLENWLAAVNRISVDNFLIVSLDEQLHHYLEEKMINSIFRPCELNLRKLWIHRVDVILELMEDGYDVIHSDADAVWLKDPQPFLTVLSHDMFFSQGTVWPQDVYEKWNFVLCCGFFYMRSNQKTLKFIKELAARVRVDKDDQVSCNRMLHEKGITWEESADKYELIFRDKPFICSNDIKNGEVQGLKIALLPHAKFQRIYEKSDEVYIRHLISEKDSSDILEVLDKYGCKFV